MNILLVYPKHPETFWSFNHALKFIGKKSAFPPLGLLTMANALPKEWHLKMIDMNIEKLDNNSIAWADYVFISAISIQRASVLKVIEQCQNQNTIIVAGGPLFTAAHDEFVGIDHFVLGEAELTLPVFINDLAAGRPKTIYQTSNYASLTETPVPRWDLIKQHKYGSMSIQFSRGCPFNCDFCDITLLYGKKTRTKSKEQVLAELDLLYNSKWRGPVFFVDDNFIGNKQKLKTSILPAITDWMEKHHHPFSFFTQASINLADDQVLLNQMVTAGFDTVFIGIESPNEDSLKECLKSQNTRRNLIDSIKKCQQSGLQIQGGFIVGFDSDPASIFDQHISFIQQSGIPTAMVGLLNAMKGTALFQRLKAENRLLQTSSGDNTDFSINFIPKMDMTVLVEGYKRIINQIYSPKNYYKRVKTFLQELTPPKVKSFTFRSDRLMAFAKSIFRLGILGKERCQYWKLIAWTLVKQPSAFPLAISLAINGFHFRKVFKQVMV